MTGRGRPLRFLAAVMMGWIGVRVAILWPQTGSLPRAIEAVFPFAAAADASAPSPTAPAHGAISVTSSERAGTFTPDGGDAAAASVRSDPAQVQAAMYALIGFGRPEPAMAKGVAARVPQPFAPAAQPFVPPPLPDRWSASAWLSARPGVGLGAAPGGGQIGGSQAGARIAYMLAPRHRLAAVARIASPLGGRGAEAAVALEWQPLARVPVRAVVEHRFGLDGTEGGPGIGIVTGFESGRAEGVHVEAYGQAGAVWRTRSQPYADGAVRVTHGLADARGVRLSLGVGAWGAAQRDAARLDIGPSAVLTVPISGRNVRLAIDWRQRVAGDARPGSGPALTIGGDF